MGGCELRNEVIVKIKKKVGGGSDGVVGGRVGGCEPRIEVVKMQKKSPGVRSGGPDGGGLGWM